MFYGSIARARDVLSALCICIIYYFRIKLKVSQPVNDVSMEWMWIRIFGHCCVRNPVTRKYVVPPKSISIANISFDPVNICFSHIARPLELKYEKKNKKREIIHV